MTIRGLLSVLFLTAALNIALARIVSSGTHTVQPTRARLPDRAFLITNNRKPDSVAADGRYFVYKTSPKKNPALAAADTQVQVNTVHVRGGKAFTMHYHPRGTETLTLNQGRLVSQLWFEGAKPRRVQIVLHPYDSTVFPQGLVHLVHCVSKQDCIFTAVFNTADPGGVPVRFGYY